MKAKKRADETTAKKILGDDFITSDEIAKASEYKYRGELVRHFNDTIPQLSTLKWLKKNNCMLVAGPPQPMSFFEISRKVDSFSEMMNPEWLMLGKAPWMGIINIQRCWGIGYLREEEKSFLYNPNAAEVAWGMKMYFLVRGVNLLEKEYLYTSTQIGETQFYVHLGFMDFRSKILVISMTTCGSIHAFSYWEDEQLSEAGIAFARMRDT